MIGGLVDLAGQQVTALELAAQGLYVFPLDHPALLRCIGRHAPDRHCDGTRGKHPACAWSKASTADPERVGRMFGGGPRNVGVDAGQSGLLVLDEDAPGEVARLCADLTVAPPATFTVSTGKGFHYYYRQPEGLPFGNGVGRLAGYRVDVRGRGGYVVGPGSTHESGRRYQVADPAPVVGLPRWLAEALRPAASSLLPVAPVHGRVTNREVAGVLDVVLTTRAGGRNNALYWSACRFYERVRDARLDEAAAVAMLLDAAGAVGLPLGEARSTIASARKAVWGR